MMEDPTLPAMVQSWLDGYVVVQPPRGIEARRSAAELLHRLDDPQDRVRAVHVVGTAGKGTVAGLVSRSLRAGGRTVGLHRSPHVADVRERFTVTDELPSWSAVAAAVEEVRPAADAQAAAGRAPSFFAVTAALALVLARQADTDHLVVEAGIGGRFDATNTFHRADVITAVTAIGVDHAEVLGSTVSAIAAEKAAVLAGRSVAVLGPQPDPAAAEVVRGVAVEHGVRLVEVADAPSPDWRVDAETTAAAVLHELGGPAARPVFASEPGRLDTVDRGGVRWVFDGAHNPLKLGGLARVAAGWPRPIVAVVALGSAKDVDACAAALAPAVDAVVAVAFGPNGAESGPRSVAPDAVATAFAHAGVAPVVVASHPAAAVAAASDQAPATVVVTGSFLHLAAVRAALTGDAAG